MLYTTLYSLLGLTALIPFAVSIPANRATSGTHIITPGPNPLPPFPPGWFPIPDTDLSIDLLDFGAAIPPQNVADCIRAAQAAIASTIAIHGDVLLPSQGWEFTQHDVRLSSLRIFPTLGTYSQLSAAIGELPYLMNRRGGRGSRALSWVLADDAYAGLVLRGAIELSTTVGAGATNAVCLGAAGKVSVAMSASFGGFEELVTYWGRGG